MSANGVQLARRISGGGAVYHDEGNLNYAFFLPRASYRPEIVFGWIIDVLHTLGFTVERVNRTSLVVAGKKVSGNAFCYRRDAVLHHGTLLVTADLSKLRRALQPRGWSFTSRATVSVPMSVTNLADLQPGLSLADVESAFVDHFGEGALFPNPDAVDSAEFVGGDWLWNRTPEFHVDTGDLSFTVQHGMIIEGPAEWLGRSFAECYSARQD
jgi:lipoate-protein ligase A